MKRSFIMLLVMVLLLTGCSLRFTLPEETEAYVPVPTTTVAQTEATEEPTEPVPTSPDGTPRQMDAEGRILAVNIYAKTFTLGSASDGDSFQICGYDGGEMRLPFKYMGGHDTDLAGLGLMVFLDGLPQPYKLAEDGKYEYMHVFTDLSGEGTLYFTPVCGKTGDELELCAVLTPAPDWYPQEKRDGGQVKLNEYANKNNLATGVILQFNADPEPASDFPAVHDRVEELTISEESFTFTDAVDVYDNHMGGTTMNPSKDTVKRSEQIMDSIVSLGGAIRWGFGREDAEIRFKPVREGQFAYNVKETSKVNFVCGIYCGQPLEYNLILYCNGQPISVDPEDVVRYTGEGNGTKMVASFTLDMTEMSDINKITIMAVARNYQTLRRQGEFEDTSYAGLGFNTFIRDFILTSYGSGKYLEAVSN